MRIRLTHPKYQVLAKTDEALILQGESVVTLFPDAVAECAVTISQNTIHVAALSKYNTVLHWYGNGSAQFQYQEVVTEKLPIRGLRLVTDSAGTPNLLYMQQSPKQTSWSLIQHSFLANEWSDPMRVTGNISSDPNHWQVCFGADQSLHLVYLSQEHDTLFYRAADMKTRTWTGAVPITREYAEYPQIFAAGYGLVVFWISHLEQGKVLRAVVQLGTWSKPYDLSPIAKDIFQPGIEFDKNQFRIMWMQSGKLWYTSYDQNWSQAEQLELDQRQFGYQTVLSGQGLNFGCCVMRVYYQRQIEVSPEKAEPRSRSSTRLCRRKPRLRLQQKSLGRKRLRHRNRNRSQALFPVLNLFQQPKWGNRHPPNRPVRRQSAASLQKPSSCIWNGSPLRSSIPRFWKKKIAWLKLSKQS